MRGKETNFSPAFNYYRVPFHCFEPVIIINNLESRSLRWNRWSLLGIITYCFTSVATIMQDNDQALSYKYPERFGPNDENNLFSLEGHYVFYFSRIRQVSYHCTYGALFCRGRLFLQSSQEKRSLQNSINEFFIFILACVLNEPWIHSRFSYEKLPEFSFPEFD